MVVQHVAVDGSTVSIDVQADLSYGFSSYLHAILSGQPQEFGVGPHRWAAELASDDNTIYEQEYSYQGGTLRLGFDVIVDPTNGSTLLRRTAVWEGNSHSMSAFVHERS